LEQGYFLRLLARRSDCLISACGLLTGLLTLCSVSQAQTKATAATPPTLPMQSPAIHSQSSIKRVAAHRKSRKVAQKKKKGQQKIDPDRAREIQEALIRADYLDGVASGNWDNTSQKAMEKFQADNGWQTVVVPDSRALIKLGLGPDHEHLLNPETAMTSLPERAHAETSAPSVTSSAPSVSSSAPSTTSVSPITETADPARSDH